MKKIFLIISLSLAVSAIAQEIPQNQVPALIVNNFQKQYPKAHDVSWEIKGAHYKVEFETGIMGHDHDIWYDTAGKIIRQKEKISKIDLPTQVIATINKQFNGYRVKDIKKITEGTTVSYTMELKSLTEEWEVIMDVNGKILSKVAD